MSGITPRGFLGGGLLVATPLIDEPTFRRTVIAVLHHDGEGAIGVVLNRPTALPVSEPFPGWNELAADPPVMFSGGPVSPTGVICLARRSGPVDPVGWTPVLPEYGTLDLARDPDEVRPAVTALRMFTGYAGWAAGQLEDELDEGAWIVAAAQPRDLLSEHPESLWADVLRRQPGRTRLLASYPPDIRLQ